MAVQAVLCQSCSENPVFVHYAAQIVIMSFYNTDEVICCHNTCLDIKCATTSDNRQSAYTKPKVHFVVTAQLISTFVFTTKIVLHVFFFYLNLKFQAFQRLYRLVCVGPGGKPELLVFSCYCY